MTVVVRRPPELCPDCGAPWNEEADACPRCHLTGEDVRAAADFVTRQEEEHGS